MHNTVDRKYFVRKNFVVFNFCGWSQPQKLNTDHTLYVTLSMSTIGTATMDTHRTLKKKKKRQACLTRNGPIKPLSESALESRFEHQIGL